MAISTVNTKLYFNTGIIGSALLHTALIYGLFTTTLTSKPFLEEMHVMHITLLEEAPKPSVKIHEPIEPQAILKEIPHPVLKPRTEPKVVVKPKKVQVVEPKHIHDPKESTLVALSSEKLPLKTISPVKEISEESPLSSSAKSSISPNTLSLYLTNVRKKIQKNLVYPSMAKKMGLEGESLVQFDIEPNGAVNKASLKIIKSSGTKILDTYALEAVLEAAPFENPPQEHLHISIPIVFNIRS